LGAAGAPESEKARAAAGLRRNVWVELGLGMVIVLVVAVLGLMQPAVG
jgi:putative copper export protein